MRKENKKEMLRIAKKEMNHNPFFVEAVEKITENDDSFDINISAKLAQVYEQHLRNKMAYRTAESRDITDKDLDRIFK